MTGENSRTIANVKVVAAWRALVAVALFALSCFSETSFAAMPALSSDTCSRGGLGLKLRLVTDTGLTTYDQRLELNLTGGQKSVGTASRPLKEQTVAVNAIHCGAWLKSTGVKLPRLMAILKAPQTVAEKKLPCDKKGRVEVRNGTFTDAAEVCIAMGTKTARSQAFREIYESTELFLSVP